MAFRNKPRDTGKWVRDKYIDLWTVLRHIIPLSRAPDPNLADRNLPGVEVVRPRGGGSFTIPVDTYIHIYPPLRIDVYSGENRLYITPGKFYSLFIIPIREPPDQHFVALLKQAIYGGLNAYRDQKYSPLGEELENWMSEGELLFSIIALEGISDNRDLHTQIYLPREARMKDIGDLLSLASESNGGNRTGLALIWGWGFPKPSPQFVIVIDPYVVEDLKKDGKVGAGYHLSGRLFVLGRKWTEKISKGEGELFGSLRTDFFFVEDSFYQVYKAHSLIKTTVSIGKGDEELQLPDEGGNLAKLRFHSDMRIIRGVYAAVISLRTDYGRVYSPPLYLREGPGYRIVEGHGIEIRFNEKKIRDVIKGVLLDDRELFAILLLKYHIFSRLRGKGGNYQLDRIANLLVEMATGSDEEEGVSDNDSNDAGNIPHISRVNIVDEIVSQIDNALKNPKKFLFGSEGDKFIDFSVDVLMHTMSHSLINFLSIRYGASPNMLFYAFTSLTDWLRTSEILREDEGESLSIILAENSEGGYGISESLLADVKEGRLKTSDILREMLEALVSKDGVDLCEVMWQNHVRVIEQDQVLSKILNEYGDFLNRMREIRDGLERKYGIGPPIELVRQMIVYDDELQRIVHKMRKEKGRSVGTIRFKDIGALITPLIDHEIPYCWDGCLGCIRLERGCSFQPYDQIFSLSKRLLQKFLRALISPKASPQSSGKNMGTIIKEELGKAKKIVRIVTPFFTPEVLDQVVDPLLDRGIEVKLIISSQKKIREDHLEHLEEKLAKYKDLFKYHLVSEEFVHMKAYIVDDEILITGSVNLTWGGFYENIEQVQITHDKVEIYKRISEFEELMPTED